MPKIKLQIKAEDLRRKLNIKDGIPGPKGEVGETGPAGRDGLPGRPGKDADVVNTDLIVAESVKQAQEAILPKIPTLPQITENIPMEATKIRDSLEVLTGDDRLSKDAIAGLENYDETLEKIEKMGKGGGGSTARFFYQLVDVDGNSYVGKGGMGVFVKADASGLEFKSVGGSQTPWTSDIDGGGHSLTDVKNIYAKNIAAYDTSTYNEKVLNPNITSSSFWAFTGPWTYNSAHRFDCAPTGGGYIQPVGSSVSVGKYYTVVFTITNYVSGNVQLYVDGNFPLFNVQGNGTYSYNFLATNGSAVFPYLETGSSTTQLSITYFSVREAIGNGIISAESFYGHLIGYADQATTADKAGYLTDFVGGEVILSSGQLTNFTWYINADGSNNLPTSIPSNYAYYYYNAGAGQAALNYGSGEIWLDVGNNGVLYADSAASAYIASNITDAIGYAPSASVGNADYATTAGSVSDITGSTGYAPSASIGYADSAGSAPAAGGTADYVNYLSGHYVSELYNDAGYIQATGLATSGQINWLDGDGVTWHQINFDANGCFTGGY